MYLLIFTPIVLAVVYSAYVMLWLEKQPKGNAKMVEISQAIQEGSAAFLNRQYKSVAVVAVILLIGIYYFLGTVYAAGFLVGALASAAAGYIGMDVAVR